jgi:hypothetical protein
MVGSHLWNRFLNISMLPFQTFPRKQIASSISLLDDQERFATVPPEDAWAGGPGADSEGDLARRRATNSKAI